MTVGAVIIADGKTTHGALLPATTSVGSVSAVKRLIGTFEQAGAENIVIVTDESSFSEVEKHTARMGTLCLCQTEKNGCEMIDFAKTGLQYLQKKCDVVLLTPVDTPLFTAQTVQRLLQAEKQIASPVYKGKAGHPLLLSSDVIVSIMQYQGTDGLRGAIKTSSYEREFVEVTDAGILCNVASSSSYNGLLEEFKEQSFHPSLKLRLVKEKPFFGPGAAQLLTYIYDTGSVRLACQQMGISYSKAWKIIDVMEQQTTNKIVERQQGGKNGGKAYLTQKGIQLLKNYKKFEKACNLFAQKTFEEIFKAE